MNDQRFDELVEGCAAGTLTPHERHELARAVVADPDRRRALTHQVRLSHALASILKPRPAQDVARSLGPLLGDDGGGQRALRTALAVRAKIVQTSGQTSGPTPRWRRRLTVSATICALTAVAAAIFVRRPATTLPEPVVARLTVQGGTVVVSRAGTRSAHSGAVALWAGDGVEVPSGGLVRVVGPGGASVDASGQAEFVMGPGPALQARLDRGNFTCALPHLGDAFTLGGTTLTAVQSPARFAVSARPGEVDLDVHAGAILVRRGSGSAEVRVPKGRRALIGVSGVALAGSRAAHVDEVPPLRETDDVVWAPEPRDGRAPVQLLWGKVSPCPPGVGARHCFAGAQDPRGAFPSVTSIEFGRGTTVLFPFSPDLLLTFDYWLGQGTGRNRVAITSYMHDRSADNNFEHTMPSPARGQWAHAVFPLAGYLHRGDNPLPGAPIDALNLAGQHLEEDVVLFARVRVVRGKPVHPKGAGQP